MAIVSVIKRISLSVCALRRRFYRDDDPGLVAAMLIVMCVVTILFALLVLLRKLFHYGPVPMGWTTFLTLGLIVVISSYSLGPVVKRWDHASRRANPDDAVGIEPAVWTLAGTAIVFAVICLAVWLLRIKDYQ